MSEIYEDQDICRTNVTVESHSEPMGVNDASSPALTRNGFWLQTNSQAACEIARISGFDLVIFDVEHGTFDQPDLDHLVPFCSLLGLDTYVRVSHADRPHIQAALDTGASGIILPQIRDLDHAREVTAFGKYPPVGSRGFGFNRTMRFGAVADPFIGSENSHRQCFAMIETRGALESAEDIARLPCVDGLFIGPSDLSLSRGRGVFKGTGADLDDLREVAQATALANKHFAAAAPNDEYRKEAESLKANFVAIADELSAMAVGFSAIRGAK